MADYHIEVMIPEDEVDRRIKEIGEQITKDYAGKQVHLICVLKGGSFFLCELVKRINLDVSLDFMSLLSMMEDRKPASLKLCTLLDKPSRRVMDVNVDYTGFEIPDEFVVGYGLDYDQKYRNLPYIGVVKFD